VLARRSLCSGYVFERRRIESTEIIIKHIDARDTPAGEGHEQWIRREPLDIKYSLRAGRPCVEQEMHLRRHRVDDAATGFQMSKAATQLTMQTEVTRKRIERDQSTHRRQSRVRTTHTESRYIGAPNPASFLLKLPSQSRLATRASPSHLPGARRVDCFCHRKQNDRRAEP